jgi:hypothetical protein
MTSLRPGHVLLLGIGLVMCVAMLAVLIPKLGHLSTAKPPPQPTTTAQKAPPPTAPAAPLPKPAAPVAHRAHGHGWLTAGHIFLIVAVSFILSCISLAGWLIYVARRRLGNRLAREYGLYEIKLSMHDQAKDQDLADMVEALANAVREFPEQRGRDGQPFIAIEAHYGPGPTGEMEWVLCLRCEKALAATIDGIISSAYQDVRVGYDFLGPPQEIRGTLPVPGHVLRFRKDRKFVHPISDDSERTSSSPIEAVAQTQIAVGVPSTVRFQFTPCMLPIERFARGRLRSHEGGLLLGDAGQLGTLNRAEMASASEAQSHAWFWLEAQVAADTRENANRIAAAVQARRGQNRLQRRWMILREDLYRRRFPSAYPPILPSPSLRTLVSSREIAHLIELPGARMRSVPVRRLALPRIPAPPEIGLAPGDPEPELPSTDGQTL